MLEAIVSFIVVLGVLIFFHELGHFVVARWAGVGVLKFSLGFGPKLWSWKIRRDPSRRNLSPDELPLWLRVRSRTFFLPMASLLSFLPWGFRFTFHNSTR